MIAKTTNNELAISTKTNNNNLLVKFIHAVKQTEESRAQALIKMLINQVQNGTMVWQTSLLSTINLAIAKIDEKISKQLTTIIQHKDLQKLEGSWRGLNFLVKNTPDCQGTIKIHFLHMQKNELFKTLNHAMSFDQSFIFKKIYDQEYATPGGEPYSVLIGDYEFGQHSEDIQSLRYMAQVAAAAFCPFITAANPSLIGLNHWSELSKPNDLSKIFSSPTYTNWHSLRQMEESRFITLTLPRVLARLPYGTNSQQTEAFNFEEFADNQELTANNSPHNFCWMNSAYVLAERITQAIAKHGWATAIRGAEGGGKVENLPCYHFISDQGTIDTQCPTEIGITDRRETELSALGFLPLCHYKNTNYAVYFGAQSIHKPKNYDLPQATSNATIAARLPYILATSRFAHYLKVMARDKIGSFLQVEDCERWLNRWINTYVNANAGASAALKAKYPLAEASISVEEIPGKPGAYHAVAHLRPWLQFEALTASLRLVAAIPNMRN
ncbi:MAG: type VI secretion system contractile sheath large subunit [Pseudomonadota bacterium]